MDGFVPHEGRKKKGKASIHKDKRTAVDDASIDVEDFPYLNGDVPVDLDDFFDFQLPSVEGSSTEVPEFAEASRTVNEVIYDLRPYIRLSLIHI